MKNTLLKSVGCIITSTLILLGTSAHAGLASASANQALINDLASKKPYLDYCFELLKLYYYSNGVAPEAGTIDVKVSPTSGIDSVKNQDNMRCVMTFDQKPTTSAILRGKIIAEACRPTGGAGLYDCNSDIVLSNIEMSNYLKGSQTPGSTIVQLAQAGYSQPIFSPLPDSDKLGDSY